MVLSQTLGDCGTTDHGPQDYGTKGEDDEKLEVEG